MSTIKGASIAVSLAAGLLLASTPATAQRGPGWGGGSGWGGPMDYPRSGNLRSATRSHDPREGRVDVSRFVIAGPDAQALGRGAVAVVSESGEGAWVESGQRAAYEAAIVDALVGAGYDTKHAPGAETQITMLRVSRQVLIPAEEKRSPVSGTAAVEVGSRGSAYGLGINVDFTKPRPALVSTRLDARITDKASGKVLWEGYAAIATREGDEDWGDGRIAQKLADALFDNFPKADSAVLAGGQG